jgi:small subunit ribosomal protein S20
MANHKATKKDARQSAARNLRNRYKGKTTRNAMRALLASTDKAVVAENLPKVVAMLDKLAKTNIIHKNKAANLKSAIMKKANATATA